MIAHNEGRKEKELWTEAEAGEPITLYDALDERDEAAYIANMARRRQEMGTRPGEIAVLYRTNGQSRVIEEAFVRAGETYRVYGGLKFYDRKEVKDLIAYMRCLVNPDDDVSTRRIINEPKRSIGESTVERLANYAQANEMSLLSAALDYENAGLTARARTSVAMFAELMIDLTEVLYSGTPSEFLQAVLDRTGYLKQFTEVKNEENEARLENISELQGAVTEYEQQNPQGGVTDFLENVALVTDLDNMNETGGAITLMTLHSAKGLEFDCVFLAGMEETIFPISRAMFDDNQMEEERQALLRGHYPGQEKAVHDPRPHPHALQQPSGQPDFPLRFGNSHPADSGRAGRRGHAHSAGGPRAEGSPELRPQTRRQRRFPGHSRGAEGLRRGKRPGPAHPEPVQRGRSGDAPDVRPGYGDGAGRHRQRPARPDQVRFRHGTHLRGERRAHIENEKIIPGGFAPWTKCAAWLRKSTRLPINITPFLSQP